MLNDNNKLIAPAQLLISENGIKRIGLNLYYEEAANTCYERKYPSRQKYYYNPINVRFRKLSAIEDYPVFWESIKTKFIYPFNEFSNHGSGGLKSAFVNGSGTIKRQDLPDEYPFTLIYQTIKIL